MADEKKNELKSLYERLIYANHNYKYLQDIIDKYLLY